MIKRRISTNISQKHWELLTKYKEKYGTQQKTLEVALENLENNSKQSPELTLEQKAWMRANRLKVLSCAEKNLFKVLTENTNVERLRKYMIKNRSIETGIEFLYQKPLKEMSLQEFIYGFILSVKLANWFDTVDYHDEGSDHKLIITHTLSPNVSIPLVIAFESALKNYGVDFQITNSEVAIFIKVFKN